MRRSILALSLALSAFALAACEDGPDQTFNPAPSNAANEWNNSNADAAVDPATQGFLIDAGGTNKQNICSAAQEQAVWQKMVTQPIDPPTTGAGIDMSGGPTWPGLTIEQAEQELCQSTNLSSDSSTETNYWGGNGEVVVSYYLSNHHIYYLGYEQGYVGFTSLVSRDGQHKYQVGPIGSQITLDGAKLELNWAGVPANPNADLVTKIEAMVDAFFATFAPALPPDPHCLATGHCKLATFSDGSGYMYIPAMGWAFRVQSTTAAQPTPSIVYYMDEYLEKVVPFAYAAPFVKLDNEGPIAVQTGLGATGSGAGKTCTLRLTSASGDLSYGNFLSNCVEVTGTAEDQTELNKLLGGIQHGTETYSFDVAGVDINFKDNELPTDQIVTDSDRPQANDSAVEMNIDQSTLGQISNDYKNNDPNNVSASDPTQGFDYHGSGLVNLEYAILVQSYLQQFRPQGAPVRTIGDANCMLPNVHLIPGTTSPDPNYPIPAGCTGFEGVATFAPKASVSAADGPGILSAAHDYATVLNAATTQNDVDSANMIAALKLGLKPGSPDVVFCANSDGGSGTPVGCVPVTLWDGAFQQVIQWFGHGNLATLPVEVQDRRFFWKMWATALLGYLEVADQANITLDDVQTAVKNLQQNDLFFDSVGTGQFETAEYVDRRFVSAGQAPTDLSMTADILNGIFNNYTFERQLFRGEKMLYAAVQCTATGSGACAPGDQAAPALAQEENRALLTNLFGSPLLSTAYPPVTQPDGSQVSGYYCATNIDLTKCCGAGSCELPPLVVNPTTTTSCQQDSDCAGSKDANGNTYPICGPATGVCSDFVRDQTGNPILAGYPGAMGGAQTVFSLGTSTVLPATLSIVNTYQSIESAMVNLQFHQDPYDPTSNYSAFPPNTLVPWLPKQAGVGFPIALDGVRDKFVETAALDLSGVTLTANIDYDFNANNEVEFKAVESSDFLGDVFVCQDANTGDILTARMYSSVAAILDWFAAHPSAYNACQMITRYSPYDNYADYITSLQTGVRLSVTQGGGYGRIVDVILFTPGQ